MRRGYPTSNSKTRNTNQPNYPQNNIPYPNQPYYQYTEPIPSNYTPQYAAVPNPQLYASPYPGAAYPSAPASNVTSSQLNAWPYNQGYYYDPNSAYPYTSAPSTINSNQSGQGTIPYGNQTSPNMQAFKNIIPHQDVHQLLDHKGTKVKVSKIYRIQKTKLDNDDSSDDETRRQPPPPPPLQMQYVPPEAAQRIPSATSSCSHCSTCSDCSCTACLHEKNGTFDDNCAACRSEREQQRRTQHNPATKISKDRK